MKSLREIYRIGTGPSSSHTMGPRKAAENFLSRHTDASRYEIVLYGSLAATGRGHMTDVAITEVFSSTKRPVKISWQPDIFLPFHPNGMTFRALDSEGNIINEETIYSIGGGAIRKEGQTEDSIPEIYDLNTLSDILEFCEHTGSCYWEYVQQCEGKEIWDFLSQVWVTMRNAVERGVAHEGRLPGPLNLRRKAPTYFVKAEGYRDNLRSRGLTFAYALAVSEENASGGTIVTAPTCGSCGVVPGVLYHLWKSRSFSDIQMIHALATAGLIGNVVKHNASISGAEVGCQGEVGVACAMAAAAACQLFGGTPRQIEYAAEMGLEHHLGMTCDPVMGLVQIPCIERNAYAAARALDANIFAAFSDGNHRISFDKLVTVMKETGHDLPSLYKETGTGGLAKDYKQQNR